VRVTFETQSQGRGGGPRSPQRRGAGVVEFRPTTPTRSAAPTPNGTTAYDSLTKDPSNPMLPRTFRDVPAGVDVQVITTSAVLESAPDLATKLYPTLTALPLPNTPGPEALELQAASACGAPARSAPGVV